MAGDQNKRLDEIVAQARAGQRDRETTYRERALKLFPHVCGRCGREFSGKRLKELTVHHRDHNHDNNPPDGSNWELLCIYCHDNEHARNEVAAAYADPDPGSDSTSNKPFATLGDLFKTRK